MNMHTAERGRKAAERVDAHLELKSLSDALLSRDAEIKAFASKATDEIKSIGALSTETKNALEKLSEKGGDIAARMAEVEQKLASRGGIGQTGAKSLGEHFVNADEFKALQTRGKGSARLTVKAASITSDTTASTAGNAGIAITPDRQAGIITPAQRVLTIRSLLLPGSTSSNSVEFVRETGFTNSAASVAEAAARAQSDLTFEAETANVRTIGHFFQVSKQVLSDIPLLKSYIDNRATYGLKLVEENQLLSGDGTGQNLHGLLPQASRYQEVSDVVTGDTRIDIIRRAALQVRLAEYVPNFVALHPTDWAEIELTKDNDNRYIWVNVQVGGTPMLWRLNVVETTAVAEGQFLVGAGMGAQVFDREQASVELSTEHADNFIKGMATILAEERLAFAVTRPESFVWGQFELMAETTINV